MALKSWDISEIQSDIPKFCNNIDNTTINRNENFSRIQEQAAYQAWVKGTEYGATFEEKLNKINEIANKVTEQGKAISSKLLKFANNQEQINTQGSI